MIRVIPRSCSTLLAASLLGVFVLAARAPVAHAADATVVIDGKGWGHGVGMAQDGALAMGRAGATTTEILGHFYPGTQLEQASGRVRVDVRGAAPVAVVAFPDGGQVLDLRSGRQSRGFPVTVHPGGQVELRFDGATYTARPLAGATLHESANPPAPAPDPAGATPASAPPVPPPATEAQSGRSLLAVPPDGGTVSIPERGRRYRGLVEAVGEPGGLRLMNEVDVEMYLRGMGEVRDPSWPAAGLQAQAVAARTYALRAMKLAGQLCDTQRCQVYLGRDAEYGAMNQAVADTAGQVLAYNGAFALTVYSANAGGFSATPEEGWGGAADNGSHPYLRAAPYPIGNPDAWTEHTTLVELSRRFGGGGEPTGVRVSRTGPSGRALEVTIEGRGGPVAVVDGQRLASTLGLRSNFFTIRVEGPPPAPPPAAEPVEPVAGTGAPFEAPALPARFDQPSEDSSPGPWLALAGLVGAALFARHLMVLRRRRAAAGLP